MNILLLVLVGLLLWELRDIRDARVWIGRRIRWERDLRNYEMVLLRKRLEDTNNPNCDYCGESVYKEHCGSAPPLVRNPFATYH